MATSEAQLGAIDRYAAKAKERGIKRLTIALTPEMRAKLDGVCKEKGIVYDRGATVGEPNYIRALVLLADLALEAGLDSQIKN